MADLNIHHSELQERRQELAKNLVGGRDFGLHDKKMKKHDTEFAGDNPFGVKGYPGQHGQSPAGTAGFTRPGELNSPEDTSPDSDSSVDSKVSKKHRCKSGTKRRRKLLRLNQ